MNIKTLSLLILSFHIEFCLLGQYNGVNSSVSFKPNIVLTSSKIGGTQFIGAVSSPLYLSNYESAKFHFYNDFNENLQVDKFIHSFGSYVVCAVSYKGLINAKVSKNTALIIGGTMSMVLLSTKDFYDGFNLKGFSWGDILANFIGVSFYVSQELLFDEQVLKYKFSYSRSYYAEQANGYLGKTFLESYFKDYNGHTYWLSINIRKLLPKLKVPEWINISTGYSANGMYGSLENINFYNGMEIPETQRYRQFLFSLDVDWSKINVNSKFLRTILNGINFIKIPFPAIEINSKGQFKGYWIYF